MTCGLLGLLMTSSAVVQARPPAEQRWAVGVPDRIGVGVDLGFAKRLDEPSSYVLDEPYGATVGAGVEAPLGDRLALGLRYEFRALGGERSPVFATGIADVTRRAHAMWLAMRMVPFRGELVGVFLGVRVAPVWQSASLVASTWEPIDPGRAAAVSCSGGDTAGVALGAEFGAEARVSSSVRVVTAAGFTSMGLSDDVLNGCVPGAGSVLSAGMRTGFVFDIDFAHE